jgi:hypothetical protein
MLVDVDHQRRDRAVPAVGANLVEAEARLLPEFGRLGDARVPQGMTPDVQADFLSEFSDDAQDGACLEAPVSVFAALAARQK